MKPSTLKKVFDILYINACIYLLPQGRIPLYWLELSYELPTIKDNTKKYPVFFTKFLYSSSVLIF